MRALSLFKEFASETRETVIFVQQRCLRRRLNSCDCRHCLDSCPAGAVSLDSQNLVQLDSMTCSRCMRCIAVCPNDAFVSPHYEFEKLFASTVEKHLAVISCSRQKQVHPGETVVPCLGIFSAQSLLLLGMTGPSTAVFNISECFKCENRSASDAFLRSVAELQKHASLLLKTRLTVVTDPDQISSVDKDTRRSFFSVMKESMLPAAGSQSWHGQGEGDEGLARGRRIPQNVRLIKNLTALLDEEQKSLLADLYVHQLAVSKECTLCPLCTGICPTGALKVGRINGVKQLRFNSSICSGCCLCVSFCRAKAISLFPSLISAMTQGKALPGKACKKQEIPVSSSIQPY